MLDPLPTQALALAQGREADANAIADVAAQTSPEAAAWAFTQWRLRERAKRKFARAEQMLFSAEALEQATHEQVAAYHATLFPIGALIGDLCTGIGGDAIALAWRGPVLGYEPDGARAALARHNLAAHGLGGEVREEDCLGADWSFDFAFADPARRVEGRRTLRMDEFQPDPARLAERMKSLRLGAIKLSPLLKDEDLMALGGRVEFLSHEGECKEALVLLGADSGEPGYEAVHIESGERLAGSPTPRRMTLTDEPETWFFEADPAVIRAHALPALAERYDLFPLGRSNGYLTGRSNVESSWLKAYRIVGFAPTDPRQAGRALTELNSATPAVKTRSVNVDPFEFGRKLRLKGRRRFALAYFPSTQGRLMGLILDASTL
ncbi:MAG: methyltransferase [Chthonomonas sp.]